MSRLRIASIAAAIVLALTTSASATVLLDEGFDAYPDIGLGNSVVLNPGETIDFPITPIKATDAAPIVVEGNIYDLGGRATISLRASGGSSAGGVVTMGSNSTSYGFQTAYIGGPVGWTAFTTDDLSNQWNRFECTLGGTYASFELLMASGRIWSQTVATTNGSFGHYDLVRLAVLSGPVGGAAYDDILVQQLPEPASLLMLLLGGGLLRRRRSHCVGAEKSARS